MWNTNPDHIARNKTIVWLVGRGWSYASIGRKYGLSGQRISQIYRQHLRRKRNAT